MNNSMVGIIGAMEEEVAILRSRMASAQTVQYGGFTFLRGSIEGRELVLLKCGIGKVNAGAGCAVLLERFTPAFVVNTGCAGGVNNEGDAVRLDFGDIVLSEKLVYHDVDVSAFGYKPGQVPGAEQYFLAEPSLVRGAETAIDALKKAGKLPPQIKHVRGLIASGDVFMCETSRIKAVAAQFPGLRALEMEGAAIAHVCAVFGVPALVIRAISDIAGEESPVSFDKYLPIAARHSSEIVMELLRSL
ncbi:MAG: 5'-methylthioadenosine/adenosylhomocysteine nucleosidase [Spirochaetaceae bacterium]|jgi:adenosylhomocysteine nucleosidase|nr:5'-methylthioadenosine/adenosylhomocysteine nucleosidase [Spirochaetaceae bacterium]